MPPGFAPHHQQQQSMFQDLSVSNIILTFILSYIGIIGGAPRISSNSPTATTDVSGYFCIKYYSNMIFYIGFSH